MQHIPTVLDHGFEYIGGDLSTDFVNTTSGRYDGEHGHEHIQTYADLVEFAREGGVIRPGLARRLLAEAERRPDRAVQVYRRTVALREAIWRCYSRIVAEKEPAAEDVRVITAEAGEAVGRATVARASEGYTWSWDDDTDDLARPLWPIARAAADLLVDAHARGRLRECADDSCAWLFVDTTKNHSRRWCDMRGCGSRNKMRAFRQRQQRGSRAAR